MEAEKKLLSNLQITNTNEFADTFCLNFEFI